VPMRHLVVVSDLHLWQATDHDDLWMRYRNRRFLPDAQFASLVDLLEKQVPKGELALVLNGDIFDFDLPPEVDGHPVAERCPCTKTVPAASWSRRAAPSSGCAKTKGQLEGGLYRFHNEQLHLATTQSSRPQQLQRRTLRKQVPSKSQLA